MMEIKEKNNQGQTNPVHLQIPHKDLITLKQMELMYNTLSQKYPPVLKAKHVAEILQLREGTIRQWTARGIIPHSKLNGAARYMLVDLIRWLLQDKRSISH